MGFVSEELVHKYIVDSSTWVENPTYWQHYWVQTLVLFPPAICWAIVFQLAYWFVHYTSGYFWPAYKKMDRIAQTDWTSRIMGLIIIIMAIYTAFMICIEAQFHDLIPEFPLDQVPYAKNSWKLSTQVNSKGIYWLARFYILFLGYELYDLKNCVVIKMWSGVIHHLWLIILVPLVWSSTMVSLPGVFNFMNGYLTNIFAHVRGLMIHLGYRDTKLYKINKWAWWLSYVVCRLFGYPWTCGQVWLKLSAVKSQVPIGTVAFWGTAVFVHYALSLYWFIKMSKSVLFDPKEGFKRVDSLQTFPVPGEGEKQKPS
eukprot:TRINITY_DN14108_c0_g1_i1.p1 TRINITY_DN14108_c0_g1~~TRINITY_DN14108_c0_g1_i1.p1  ORF type:complete len:313 (+),score=13.24 TRINITY_DN14108_c0_g1_i1:47-985(+)